MYNEMAMHMLCTLWIQPFPLFRCHLGRFARRNVCALATEIPYWWHKICPESGQELWLVHIVIILFYLLSRNDRQNTKGHKCKWGCKRDEFTRKQSSQVFYKKASEFCWSSFAVEHKTLPLSTRRNINSNKFTPGTPWNPLTTRYIM